MATGDVLGAVRRWRGTALRVTVSVALLGMLVAVVDLSRVGEVAARVHGGLLALALAWLLLDRLLQAGRWILLLRPEMRDVPVGLLVRIHLISGFLANFLPFNVGSDGTRVVGLARYTGQVARPLSSVIVDRVLGAAVLAGASAVALMALLAVDGDLIGVDAALIVGGSVAVLLLGSALALRQGTGWIRRVSAPLERWVPRRWVEAIPRMYELCLGYAGHRSIVAGVVAILVASLFISILATWMAGRALGLDVALVHYALFVPVLSFLAVLPVSAHGLGVLEGGMVLLFTQVGATEAEALTLAVTMRLLMVAATLPGGVLLAAERWPKGDTARDEAVGRPARSEGDRPWSGRALSGGVESGPARPRPR